MRNYLMTTEVGRPATLRGIRPGARAEDAHRGTEHSGGPTISALKDSDLPPGFIAFDIRNRRGGISKVLKHCKV